jgi:hypothetical protein
MRQRTRQACLTLLGPMTRLRRRQRRAQRRLLRQAQKTLVHLGVMTEAEFLGRQVACRFRRQWGRRMKWKALRKWFRKRVRFSPKANLWWRWSPTNRRNIEVMYGDPKRVGSLAFIYGAGGRSFREIQWNVVQAHGLAAGWTPDRLREQGREFRRQYRNSRSRG